MAENNGWYLAENGASVGPLSLDDLVGRVGRFGANAAGVMVYGPGLSAWTPATQVPAIAQRLGAGSTQGRGPGMPPPPGGGRPADVIDYEIFGSEMQYVEVTLDPARWRSARPAA
jgi:hypothetical protein